MATVMRAEVMAVEAMVAVSINHCINQRTLGSFPTNPDLRSSNRNTVTIFRTCVPFPSSKLLVSIHEGILYNYCRARGVYQKLLLQSFSLKSPSCW